VDFWPGFVVGGDGEGAVEVVVVAVDFSCFETLVRVFPDYICAGSVWACEPEYEGDAYVRTVEVVVEDCLGDGVVEIRPVDSLARVEYLLGITRVDVNDQEVFA
jgi:hypothetical protein